MTTHLFPYTVYVLLCTCIVKSTDCSFIDGIASKILFILFDQL